jgi:hypothetical protein
MEELTDDSVWYEKVLAKNVPRAELRLRLVFESI